MSATVGVCHAKFAVGFAIVPYSSIRSDSALELPQALHEATSACKQGAACTLAQTGTGQRSHVPKPGAEADAMELHLCNSWVYSMHNVDD